MKYIPWLIDDFAILQTPWNFEFFDFYSVHSVIVALKFVHGKKDLDIF